MPLQFTDLTYQLEVFAVSLLLLVVFLAGLVILGYVAFLMWKYRKREERSLEYVLMQIAVPRENEIKIDAAEQLFASLHSISHGGFWSFLKPQEHISFEIVAKREDIRFYVSCPRKLMDYVEKQIHGSYSGADIKEVDEYTIFSQTGKVAFAALKLKSSNYFPMRIYRDLPVDPLSSITSVLAKMAEGEGAAVQILIQPADSKWRKLGRGYISKVKKDEANPEKASFKVDPKSLEAIEGKVSKPGFNAVVRLVISSPDEESAKRHLENLIGAFEQFASDHNNFTKVKLPFKQLFMVDFIYRYFPVINLPLLPQHSVLSTDELATIFHLPNKSVETAHIFWLNAKRAPAPSQIPSSGLFMGISRYRGQDRRIYIGEDDRRRHMYIIGKTGTGKSQLLEEMVMQDIHAGHGLAVVDPHGDLVENILARMPPERAEDVIYFDPGDSERPIGLNLLEAKTELQKHFVATSIVGLMYKLFDPMKTGIIGPRFEHAIRNAMLTVMEAIPNGTFIEVVQTLQRPDFVQSLLPLVKDPIVRRYWTDQIAQTADFHKSEVLDYIVSKFGRFITNKLIRNIIGQSNSSFEFRKVMDEGKILLVNLAKGKLGEENSNFLGLILVPRILISAMSRQEIPEEKRRDFYLYVDEFQNFATPDFAQILSEARKYRLNLIVANQFIGQMEEEVKNAVFGNVGTVASFRIGVTDANYLQHEFQPTFNESDLINIDRFNAYVKTTVHNEPVKPFSMDLTKDMSKVVASKNQAVAAAIVQLSRLKYGRSKELVEAEIAQRARL
ncbi:MAG: type IV secretion system DNA-binding domain-containing protein [Candidatus Gottesmanbacteria bacterium]|nr:type IV secretion system DNA-binding domain-containing protein [Candidatus Gottesmanbacteria bacterium]